MYRTDIFICQNCFCYAKSFYNYNYIYLTMLEQCWLSSYGPLVISVGCELRVIYLQVIHSMDLFLRETTELQMVVRRKISIFFIYLMSEYCYWFYIWLFKVYEHIKTVLCAWDYRCWQLQYVYMLWDLSKPSSVWARASPSFKLEESLPQ